MVSEQNMTTQRAVTFLVNERAGSRFWRARAALVQALDDFAERSSDPTVSVHRIADGEAFKHTVQALVCQPHQTLVAVGGDGTVHHLANQLVDTPASLGVLPAGSGNDFASLLRHPKVSRFGGVDIEALIQHFQSAPTRSVDVMHLHVLTPSGAQTLFGINSLGLGIEGTIAERIGRLSQWPGPTRYAVAALMELIAHQPRTFVIEPLDSTGKPDHCVSATERLLVSVGNGPRAGGGFVLNPKASIEDGLLDLCDVDAMPRWQQAYWLPQVYWGRHVRSSRVQLSQSKAWSIRCEAGSPLHVDGELITDQAIQIVVSVRPRALQVVG
jgi:diacylglycerol kinase (ATP)